MYICSEFLNTIFLINLLNRFLFPLKDLDLDPLQFSRYNNHQNQNHREKKIILIGLSDEKKNNFNWVVR